MLPSTALSLQLIIQSQPEDHFPEDEISFWKDILIKKKLGKAQLPCLSQEKWGKCCNGTGNPDYKKWSAVPTLLHMALYGSNGGTR